MNDAAPRTADATRRRWWAEAEALGGTSALLDHPDAPDAVLDLTTAHPSGLAQLLAGGPAPLSSLVRESGAFADARRRARAVHRRAAELLAQRGTRAPAVAVGTATWTPPAGPARRTPLLLRRCSLTPAGESLDDFVVRLDAGVLVNPVLVRAARAELGVELDAARVAHAVGRHRGFDPDPALEEVRRQLAGAPGLRVERRLLLGTFADPGSDLLAHLRDHGADVRGHRVVRALAEQVAVRPAAPLEGRPAERAARTGLELDPAQRRAVEHVLAGGDLRLEAPAGTGATQVVAALVSAGAAAGRTTLVVADSAAERRALEERLRAAGQGRLLLHLVADLDPAAVLADVREQVRTAREEAHARSARADAGGTGARPDPSAGAAALEEHARALHRPRAPWGVSAHDALEALAGLAERPVPATTTRRLRGEALTACRRQDLPVWAGRVRRAVELGAFDVTGSTTPWAGAQLRSRGAAEEALARVRRVAEETLPTARALMATVCDAVGLRGAASVAEATERVELLEGVRTTVARFGPDVFAGSLGDVAAATATAAWRRENGVRMGVLARWRLRRQARAMVAPSAAPEGAAELHEWLQRARAQRLAWQRVSVREAAPRVPEGLEELRAAVAALRTDLVDLQRVLPARLVEELAEPARGASLLEVPLPELTGLLRSLAAGGAALDDLPERTVLLDELAAAGWQPLLDDLGARWDGPGSLDLAAEVERAWWSGVLEALSLADPLVGAPDAAVLRSARAELQLAEAAARAHDA
ncbi:hypothetical protein GTR00_15930, partial [Kineococcus sp. T90]